MAPFNSFGKYDPEKAVYGNYENESAATPRRRFCLTLTA